MGLFDFLKDKGKKVHKDDDDDITKSKSWSDHLRDNGVDPTGLTFRWSPEKLTVSGTVDSQADKERAVVILGNVKGVSRVDDQIQVASAQGGGKTWDSSPRFESTQATPSDWRSDTYTVQSGDTLSGIAKKVYGDGGEYMRIFNANKPMLKDPDEIYPGQVLIIPPDTDD